MPRYSDVPALPAAAQRAAFSCAACTNWPPQDVCPKYAPRFLAPSGLAHHISVFLSLGAAGQQQKLAGNFASTLSE